jgi:cytochrome c biogenesis protein CcdA
MTALSDQTAIRSELLRGGVVGVTLLVLGESIWMAAGVAVGFLAVRALGYAIQQAVGDYADHVLLGGGILLGVWYLGQSGVSLRWLAVGGLLGGWFLLDGVQHLRYGRSRAERIAPLIADGNGPIHGLLLVVISRLLLPFRLGSDTEGGQ